MHWKPWQHRSRYRWGEDFWLVVICFQSYLFLETKIPAS
jgi:hypothetical protein